MKIVEFSLKNYRNYEFLKINPSPYINVLYGKNASGKTNVLEAISMLLTGKSFKTHRDRQTIKHGEESYEIDALISIRGLEKDYHLTYGRQTSKDLSINLTKVTSLRDLRRDSPLVIFVPEDLEIIKKSPSHRRRFIDDGISTVDIIYRYNLQKYNQVLKNKNDLLKNRNTTLDQDILLDTYNIQLASLGSYLIYRRKNYIEDLEKIAGKIHKDIARSEKLEINYKNELSDIDNMKTMEAELFRLLTDHKKQDLYRGTSTVGPHRDDYDIILDGHMARDFGSQGQQRSGILSLKFGQLELLKKNRDLDPILLLDDVFSELDINRREKLIQYIKDIQVFITMADKSYLREFDDTTKHIYFADNGNLSLIDGGNNGRTK